MASTWSDEETLKLIELWGDEQIQALLEGCTRNRHVYEKIAEGMKEAGYERSGVQCRDKTKLFSLWKLYIHCQESCHNSLACFVYDHTNCTSCNTKQMSYGSVFTTGCKTPV